MATFRVGQRVRFAGPYSRHVNGPGLRIRVGQAGTIIGKACGVSLRDWFVLYDGEDAAAISDGWQLRPLTDPKADEFIERIKKLEREPLVRDVA